MTWYGRETALEITTVEELRAYIRSGNYNNWRPSNFVVHNTASPTLYQWWHSVPPAQRMENLKNYYHNEMGWSSGPHCFIDGKSWWIMTDFWVKGVHSPSWNGTMLGFEHVGDYATESDETGMGAEVQKMGHQLSAEVCEFFGWNPDNLKFHKEDPATTHDCPGKNMVKSEYIADVHQCMGDGGGDQDRPILPRQGVVGGLVAGDRLNIRAASSSSAPIIGTAENGDEVSIVGEAMNGSTRWLRLQHGHAAGTGVAVYGWASAEYITEERPEVPPVESVEIPANQQDITATVFGGGSDPNYSAYPPYDSAGNGARLNDTDYYVALPFKLAGERPKVRVFNVLNELSHAATIEDVGPWCTTDDYFHKGTRPLAETCNHDGTPLPAGSGPHAGKVPSNDAGIDLSPALAHAIGIDGKGKVDWAFVEEGGA